MKFKKTLSTLLTASILMGISVPANATDEVGKCSCSTKNFKRKIIGTVIATGVLSSVGTAAVCFTGIGILTGAGAYCAIKLNEAERRY